MELTSFNSLIEIFNVYKNLILWFGSISLFVFLFSLLSIKWLVSLIPEDYFINKKDSKIKSSNKTHKVQLAAFAKREKAKQQAAILMEKHKNRLNGIMLEVTKIDTGSSGIYWRVITEPLLQDRAVSTCNLLKSAGQDCIVRKIRKES